MQNSIDGLIDDRLDVPKERLNELGYRSQNIIK